MRWSLIILPFPLVTKSKGKKDAAPTPSEDVSDFGKAVAALKSDNKDSDKKKKRQPKVLLFVYRHLVNTLDGIVYEEVWYFKYLISYLN